MAELSGEERQKIYEEEKARNEAQAQLKKESQEKTAKQAKSGCLGCLGLIVVIAGVLYMVTPSSTTTKTPSTANVQIDKSPEKQAGRQALIDKLVATGYLRRITPSKDFVHVEVTPLFMAEDLADKEKFVSTMYAFYFTGDEGIISLEDSRTGKDVGTFSQYGLRMK